MEGANSSPPGPRSAAVSLGLESAKHSSNILRLLESSHGATSHYNTTVDTLSTVWHPDSLCWRFQDGEAWQALSPLQASSTPDEPTKIYGATTTPKLLSMTFSDDRTALVKLQGSNGHLRYVSLLRLDPPEPSPGHHHHHHNQASNDGWIIVRELLVPGVSNNSSTKGIATPIDNHGLWTSLQTTLQTYLDIEHGGGPEDYQSAECLFHPRSSLLAVGITAPEDATTDWTAPVGSLLEISRDTYLQGVQSQTPHTVSARQHDQICSLDILAASHSSNTEAAAAVATVRVGNGAQTMIFEDHLLLGYDPSVASQPQWNILSKIFSLQAQ